MVGSKKKDAKKLNKISQKTNKENRKIVREEGNRKG
jgi:hypothetical protein